MERGTIFLIPLSISCSFFSPPFIPPLCTLQLGLHSDRATFIKHSKCSREQEVLLQEEISYNSAWSGSPAHPTLHIVLVTLVPCIAGSSCASDKMRDWRLRVLLSRWVFQSQPVRSFLCTLVCTLRSITLNVATHLCTSQSTCVCLFSAVCVSTQANTTLFINHCKTNQNLAVHEEWTYKYVCCTIIQYTLRELYTYMHTAAAYYIVYISYI